MSNPINPQTGNPVPWADQIGALNPVVKNANPDDHFWHAGGRSTRDDSVDAIYAAQPESYNAVVARMAREQHTT